MKASMSPDVTDTTTAATMRVLVVSDSRIFREGLTQALGSHDGFDVHAVSPAGHSWTAGAAGPDVLLLDIATRASVALLRELVADLPEVPVLALGVVEDEGDVLAFAESGVSGYITRDQSVDDLARALKDVGSGGAPCSPRTARMLLRRVRTMAAERPDATPVANLTARERQILALMGDGLSNKQIGQRLCIELTTVKNHVHHILSKLGAGRHGEAVALAGRHLSR